MSLITLLAPDTSMLERARKVLKVQYPDIAIYKGLLSEGVSLAGQLATAGTDIIITRGGTATAIKTAGIAAVIVEIPITGFDIIRCVERAKLHGKTIGAVSFSSILAGIECLGPILGVDIKLYPIEQEEEAESQVMRAIAQGVDVVVGGFITGKMAQMNNFPFELIDSGAEGMLQAAQEARRIAYARNLEKEKTGQFRAILDYAYEGIMAVDAHGRITVFNPIAERLIGIAGAQAVGKTSADIWPDLNLDQVVRRGKDDLGQILTINRTDVLCNKVAIRVNDSIAGAVVTFQDVGQIQQMEAKVRQRFYASGHVAPCRFTDIVGTSDALKRCIEMAKDFSLTESSVLIFGETGSGKEVFAQSIHNYSKRCKGPFVAVNCAALSSNILESELFGYVGGAFTGANPKGKAGLFEAAHGGTLFLDEIAEIDAITQGKLLRALQEKQVMRLGSDRIIPVDVRIIAATNKNLRLLVQQNTFRSDLYYRLNVLQLKIPPLRDRKADIKPLVQLFLASAAPMIKKGMLLSPSGVEALMHYRWPGNVRELKNIVERIIAVHKQQLIDAAIVNLMLEDEIQHTSLPTVRQQSSEQQAIDDALTIAKGKYSEAARLLGIDRSTLWRKMKRLGLK